MLPNHATMGWFVGAIFLMGCTSTIDIDPDQAGGSYFPLVQGMFRIYQVSSVTYNPDFSTDSSVFQLKEVVADTFRTADNVLAMVLNRFVRQGSGNPWIPDSVWWTYKNLRLAVNVEGNQPYIKLSFPLKENRIWDGNGLNGKSRDTYEMKNLGAPFEANGITYDNTVTVFKNDLIDSLMIAQDDYRVEVYSKEVGLVYKKDIVRKYCSPETCSSPSVESGILFEQQLLQVGNE